MEERRGERDCGTAREWATRNLPGALSAPRVYRRLVDDGIAPEEAAEDRRRH